MTHDPSKLIWWLVSRASGILALVLISIAVLVGLTMSTKLLRRPGVGRILMRLHESVALIALAAIALHGLALLGDSWLRPGLRGILVPFALGYRPLFTGLGILAGYLTAVLALSYYARRRIGNKRWRKLHRVILLAWLMGVVHTLGAGSDGGALWLRAIVFVPTVPIVFLAVLRFLPARREAARRTADARTAVAAPRRAALLEEAT